jgi:CubicO group peptidase (beta-lactamase class C family)
MAAGAVAGERIRALAGEGVPGVAALVAGPEGVRRPGQLGLLTSPAGPGMVCPWFSMTKIVTATAAMRLAGRGVLDLDTPLSGHVPALRQVRPTGWARRITARHLLSYSAGLANLIPVRWVHPAGQPAPDPEVFLGGPLARHGKLRFEPGSQASYPNVGPLVLAAGWPAPQATRSPNWPVSRPSARWGRAAPRSPSRRRCARMPRSATTRG